MKILGEQQCWRYWESSNTVDTGRSALKINEDIGRAAMLEILGEQQYWRYWESSNTGDTGRSALQINEDTGRAAMLEIPFQLLAGVMRLTVSAVNWCNAFDCFSC